MNVAERVPDNGSLEKRTIHRVTWKIIPFAFVLYIISYLDRANIGYAALQMNKELALSSEAFGFASGIFFIGYFLFEVPSNIALARFGARVWIARILITWGIVAIAQAFVQNATQLYICRFLLGVSEAGFFPGIIVYLTYWFRSKELAVTVAMFTAAIPVSYIIGAPLSTWLMDHVSLFGLSGWRSMIILEGVPAVLGGIACYFLFVDRPEQAKWLKDDERNWLVAELEKDRASRPGVKHLGVWKAMLNPRVMLLSFIYFVYQTGSLGVGYWMPQIIRGFSGSLTNTEIGFIATIPYIVATIAMIFWSRSSDRRDERKLHSAIPLGFAAATLAAAGYASSPYLSVGLISLALAGLYSFKAPFWALPTLFLTRETAAISVAVINSIGNLGGFVGPYAIGVIKDSTGSAMAGMIFLSVLLVISFVLTLALRIGVESPARAHAPA
jgi:ACS family tartrate transporter-like MFS transporter